MNFQAVSKPAESVIRPQVLTPLLMQLRKLWGRWLTLSHRSPRRLRLCENLPLGERRFVAVIEFEGSRFLVGGTSASLVLLDRLDRSTVRHKKESM
jgi:flagellar biogenesis protein FliO